MKREKGEESENYPFKVVVKRNVEKEKEGGEEERKTTWP